MAAAPVVCPLGGRTTGPAVRLGQNVFEKLIDVGVSTDRGRKDVYSGPVARRRQYPSDLTGEQWKLVEPLLLAVKRGGRPEKPPQAPRAHIRRRPGASRERPRLHPEQSVRQNALIAA